MVRHLCLNSVWEGRGSLICHLNWKERCWRGTVVALPHFSHSTHLKFQIVLQTSRLKGNSLIFIQGLRKGE